MQGGLAGGRIEIKDVSSLFLLLFFPTLILPNPTNLVFKGLWREASQQGCE